jgi:ABC-type branched-subunit amino acid transport system ATPase component
MALLKVEEVTSGYGDVVVLHGVSIEVQPGEMVSIIGPNGAGKSTLMKTVYGLLHPSQGRVFFDSHDITARSPYDMVKLGMCYVPQVANVFTTLTVEENLEMGAFMLADGDLKARKERIYEIFPRLSERRRACLASARRLSYRLIKWGGSSPLSFHIWRCC